MEIRTNYLCSNLSYLRKRKRLTQQKMKLLGFSRNTWSNYETGITAPSLDGLIKMSAFFHVSINELVCEDLETKEAEERSDCPHEQQVVLSLGFFHFLRNQLEKLLEEVKSLKKAWQPD